MNAFYSDAGQWKLLAPLGLSLLLATAVGLEREVSAKSAGLRTHALVGLGAAVFMLVSKYGFDDLLATDHVALDPSRVAAQIVSGIGFIGGGLIFVRQDVVRGLTTAATVWLAAAVGMACGAGLPILAVAGTAGHFVVARGYRVLARLATRDQPKTIRLEYLDGLGVLHKAMPLCAERGFVVAKLTVDREESREIDGDGDRTAAVTLRVDGRGSVTDLAVELGELPGVLQADTGEPDPGDAEDAEAAVGRRRRSGSRQ
jgi:putative Mg2+ transporter-C (MgtC) family protein